MKIGSYVTVQETVYSKRTGHIHKKGALAQVLESREDANLIKVRWLEDDMTFDEYLYSMNKFSPYEV